VGTTTILATIGSILAGGAVAVVSVVGLVSSQTGAPDNSPGNISQPVSIDYGTNG